MSSLFPHYYCSTDAISSRLDTDREDVYCNNDPRDLVGLRESLIHPFIHPSIHNRPTKGFPLARYQRGHCTHVSYGPSSLVESYSKRSTQTTPAQSSSTNRLFPVVVFLCFRVVAVRVSTSYVSLRAFSSLLRAFGSLKQSTSVGKTQESAKAGVGCQGGGKHEMHGRLFLVGEGGGVSHRKGKANIHRKPLPTSSSFPSAMHRDKRHKRAIFEVRGAIQVRHGGTKHEPPKTNRRAYDAWGKKSVQAGKVLSTSWGQKINK